MSEAMEKTEAERVDELIEECLKLGATTELVNSLHNYYERYTLGQFRGYLKRQDPRVFTAEGNKQFAHRIELLAGVLRRVSERRLP